MSTPPRRRPVGKPPKVVTDPLRAEELSVEMRRAEIALRETSARRVHLALEAYEVGMTIEAIGSLLGVSHTAVSKWVRAARDDGGITEV